MKTKDCILIGIFLDPKAVLKCWNIKATLDKNADWQTLHNFPFGELAYDSEEGLKIETDAARLPDCIKFLKDFMNKYKVPDSIMNKKYGIFHNINAKFRMSEPKTENEHMRILSDAGLYYSKEECVHVLEK